MVVEGGDGGCVGCSCWEGGDVVEVCCCVEDWGLLLVRRSQE